MPIVKFRPIEHDYRFVQVCKDNRTNGIAMHVQKIKLVKKFLWFIRMYEVDEDFFLWKPIAGLVRPSSDIKALTEPDPVFENHIRVWFRTAYFIKAYRPEKELIKAIIDPNGKDSLFVFYNHLAKKHLKK